VKGTCGTVQAVAPQSRHTEGGDWTTYVRRCKDRTTANGMVSRDLKDDEKASLKNTVIAIDALAIIVNKSNPVGQAVERTTERVRDTASAAREQALAAETMAQNVENIASMSEEISVATGGSSDSANSMRELASSLHDQVARFRV